MQNFGTGVCQGRILLRINNRALYLKLEAEIDLGIPKNVKTFEHFFKS